MSLDLSAIGLDAISVERSWTIDDVLLYAVSVGAGQKDPTSDLAFTTENSTGVAPRVLPTFGTLFDQTFGIRRSSIPVDSTRGLLHSEALTMYRTIPLEGRARATTRVRGIYDQGWGAIVVYATTVELDSGEPLLATETSVFLKGEGGFGGPKAPEPAWTVPDREPDAAITVQTQRNQALVFRLCGDRNPLHSDPVFALRCGFRAPILHGLCTYGISGRVLLESLCASDPSRFRAMSARFTRRVVPGEMLKVVAWVDDSACRFRTLNGDGQVVLDRGVFTAAGL